MKRLLRRVLLAILGFWLIVTAASLGYNAFTNGTAEPPGLDTNGGNPTETATRIGAPAPTLIPDANHLTLIASPTQVATAINALADHPLHDW